MKNSLQFICITFACCFVAQKTVAQADIVSDPGLGISGHAGGTNTGYYVGSDANTQFPLNIHHFRFNQPIVFSTNNGSQNSPNPANTTERMRIVAGPETLVGIGTANPLHTLTVFRPLAGPLIGSATTMQVTNPYSGIGQANGLLLTSSSAVAG